MLRTANADHIVPWQRMARQHEALSNRLIRVCAVMAAFMIALGVGSYSVMSNQARLCSGLIEAQNKMDQYQVKTLPHTPIVQKHCL
jgi:hypothetical protein